MEKSALIDRDGMYMLLGAGDLLAKIMGKEGEHALYLLGNHVFPRLCLWVEGGIGKKWAVCCRGGSRKFQCDGHQKVRADLSDTWERQISSLLEFTGEGRKKSPENGR